MTSPGFLMTSVKGQDSGWGKDQGWSAGKPGSWHLPRVIRAVCGIQSELLPMGALGCAAQHLPGPLPSPAPS